VFHASRSLLTHVWRDEAGAYTTVLRRATLLIWV
jgi:hypothetical protein